MEILDWFTARAVDHEPMPRRAQILAPASSAVRILRIDDRSLLVRPDFGFFCTPPSQLGYSRGYPRTPDRRISLPTMRASIVAMTPDRRPAAVMFHFDAPLEDASLQWVYWESGEFHEFRPPPVGSEVLLPASGLPF